MTITQLPVDAADPAYDVDVDLSGTVYLLNLAYNYRGGYWSMGLSLLDGTVIAEGQALRSNWEPFRQVVDERMPPGRILVIDTSGTGTEPTIDNLGDVVIVVYDDGQ